MVVPAIGRDIGAVVGELLVATAASVIGTLIVPRPAATWLTRWVDMIINGASRLATLTVTEYKRRDRVLLRRPHSQRATSRRTIVRFCALGDALPLAWPGSANRPWSRLGSSRHVSHLTTINRTPGRAINWGIVARRTTGLPAHAALCGRADELHELPPDTVSQRAHQRRGAS